jgi:hypothetical protein
MTVNTDRGTPARVTVLSDEPTLVAVMTGIPGPQGPSGDGQGPRGPSGQPRWVGTGPPGTIIGSSPGDVYLDETTGDLYTLT